MTRNVIVKNRSSGTFYNSWILRSRTLELEVEQNARKAKQFESEKLDLEKKLEDMVQKYNVVKQELDQTLKGLEDL